MTPLGHLSVSYIAGKSYDRISLPAVMLGGVLPDFDFIFLFFDWFNQVHRVISHNLLFIILASLLSAVFAIKGRKQVIGCSLLLGGFLHLLIDSCMDNNPSNGIGIALMWPFSDAFYSPFNLLQSRLNTFGWNEPLKMIKALIPVMVYEIPFYVISCFLIFKKQLKSSPVAP